MCVYFKTHWRPSNQMTRHSSHAWNILMGEPLFLLHIFLSIFKRMFFEQLWKIQLDSLLKTNATPKLKPLVKEGKMFYWAIFWRQTFLNRIMLSAQFLGGGVSVFSLLTTILSYMSPLLPPSTHVCKATELKQTAGNHSLTYLPILIIKEFESLTRAAYIFCFLRTKIKFWVPCNLKFNPVLPRLTRLKRKRYHFPYSSELLAVWLHSHERLLIRLFAMSVSTSVTSVSIQSATESKEKYWRKSKTCLFHYAKLLPKFDSQWRSSVPFWYLKPNQRTQFCINPNYKGLPPSIWLGHFPLGKVVGLFNRIK